MDLLYIRISQKGQPSQSRLVCWQLVIFYKGITIVFWSPRRHVKNFVFCRENVLLFGFAWQEPVKYTNIYHNSDCCWILSFIASSVFGLSYRCQIVVPRWPNDISSAADNAIFKNKAKNIKCSFGCMARSAILLKPNIANILLFNFCE